MLKHTFSKITMEVSKVLKKSYLEDNIFYSEVCSSMNIKNCILNRRKLFLFVRKNLNKFKNEKDVEENLQSRKSKHVISYNECRNVNNAMLFELCEDTEDVFSKSPIQKNEPLPVENNNNHSINPAYSEFILVSSEKHNIPLEIALPTSE